MTSNQSSHSNMGQAQVREHTGPRTQSRMTTRKKKKPDNRFMKFMKTPKGLVFNVLLLLLVLGVVNDRQPHDLINVGAALATGLIVDLIVGLVQKKKRLLPDGAIITALIVSLVLSTSAPLVSGGHYHINCACIEAFFDSEAETDF